MVFVSLALSTLNLFFKSWALTCIWDWYLAQVFPGVDFGMKMAVGVVLMSYLLVLPALIAALVGKEFPSRILSTG